jgi:hypothetical protein
MTDPKHEAFTALDPFFDIVQQGLAGQVDGERILCRSKIRRGRVRTVRGLRPGLSSIQLLNHRRARKAFRSYIWLRWSLDG